MQLSGAEGDAAEEGEWEVAGAGADEVIAASQELQRQAAAQTEEVAVMRRHLAEEAVRVCGCLHLTPGGQHGDARCDQSSHRLLTGFQCVRLLLASTARADGFLLSGESWKVNLRLILKGPSYSNLSRAREGANRTGKQFALRPCVSTLPTACLLSCSCYVTC